MPSETECLLFDSLTIVTTPMNCCRKLGYFHVVLRLKFMPAISVHTILGKSGPQTFPDCLLGIMQCDWEMKAMPPSLMHHMDNLFFVSAFT